jgi:D-sedoheptulose 7-phosphate isomerase
MVMSGTDALPAASQLLARTPAALAAVDAGAVEAAADLLFGTWQAGGVILACGNGGSASTASHFCADAAKLTITPGRARVRSLCLNDNVSSLTAWTNDAGVDSVYAEQARPWLETSSSLVVFSVHGGARDGSVSSNVAQVCRVARDQGASVIGVTGFDGGVVADLATVNVVVPVSDEPVATPLIESLHVLIHHALCVGLRERISGR